MAIQTASELDWRYSGQPLQRQHWQGRLLLAVRATASRLTRHSMILAAMQLTADHHIVAATSRSNANINRGPGDDHNSKRDSRPH